VRTGILGGTFDPIHVAHLHAAECAMHQAGLDRVLFIPAGEPWQKAGREVSSIEDRWSMTVLAVTGHEGFEADERELVREGPTYTIDTLESFPPEEELYLILGADSALGVPTWHRFSEVLARAGVLVVPRPGVDSTAVAAVLPTAQFIDMAVLEVSGTQIREMAREGEPFRFLVTDAVHEYIKDHHLYENPAEADMVEGTLEPEESSS
jgi:nicotinate-nucleotide adenylyltransferase